MTEHNPRLGKSVEDLQSEFIMRVLEGEDPMAPPPEPGTPEYEAFVKKVEASTEVMQRELDAIEDAT